MTEALQDSSTEFLSKVPERELPPLDEKAREQLVTVLSNLGNFFGNKETVIRGNIQLALQDRSDKGLEDAFEACQMVEARFLTRGRRFVDIIRPNYSWKKDPVQLAGIWQGVESIIGEELLERVECKIEKPEREVLVNLKDMSWAVAELVDNAIQATKKSSLAKVRVVFSKAEEELRVVVADNGGMSEGLAEALCTESGQLNKKGFESEVFPGPGFGLGIVRAVVAHHGGRVGFKTKKDEGSIFTITIP